MTTPSNEHGELITLLSAAYKQCLKLHHLFLEVANAPQHLELLGRDLHDSYLVLRTLYTLASDDESPGHFIEAAISGNLISVINDLLLIFVDVSTIITELHGRRSSDQNWRDEKSANNRTQILFLHDHLRGCKAVLNIAIYIAGSYSKPYAYHGEKEDDTIKRVTEAVEKLDVRPTEFQDLEEIKTDLFPEPGVRETSRDESREGLKPPVQDFIHDSLYLSSGLRTLVICSHQQQNSTGTDNANDSIKVYTTQISSLHKGKRGHRRNTCTQIFVRHPSSNRSIALQVRPEYTIASIKALVRRRIMMPNACFVLAHSERMLRTLNSSLEGLKVPHNSTLTCISFRPKPSSTPFPLLNHMTVYIKFLNDEKWTIQLEKDDTILGVKKQIALRLKNDISYNQIMLIFAGSILKDRKSAFECQIGHKSTLHVVLHKAVKNRLPQYFLDFNEPEPAARESDARDTKSDPEDQYSELENNELETGKPDSEAEDQESEPEISEPEIGT